MIMTFPKNMLESFRNKSVLLVGFEKTNRAFYERLKTVEGVQIGIADKNAAAKLPSGVAAHLGDDYLANMQDYDVIVRALLAGTLGDARARHHCHTAVL